MLWELSPVHTLRQTVRLGTLWNQVKYTWRIDPGDAAMAAWSCAVCISCPHSSMGRAEVKTFKTLVSSGRFQTSRRQSSYISAKERSSRHAVLGMRESGMDLCLSATSQALVTSVLLSRSRLRSLTCLRQETSCSKSCCEVIAPASVLKSSRDVRHKACRQPRSARTKESGLQFESPTAAHNVALHLATSAGHVILQPMWFTNRSYRANQLVHAICWSRAPVGSQHMVSFRDSCPSSHF